MKYRNPENVLSPKDAIKKVNVFYDGGESSVSIARINWKNQIVTGMRWNVDMGEWENQDKINGKNVLECQLQGDILYGLSYRMTF